MTTPYDANKSWILRSMIERASNPSIAMHINDTEERSTDLRFDRPKTIAVANLSSTTKMVHILNRDLKKLFRCIDLELLRLQRCLKRHMHDTLVEGKPLIGELFKEVDRDGAVRDIVWERVAQSDPMFAAMLSGARWDNKIRRRFPQRVVKAKREMKRRLNGPYRQRAKEVCQLNCIYMLLF
jgi:hypothetical protein